MRLTLYHGSSERINIDPARPMYFSADIHDAEEYALRLDDLGNYSETSYIYRLEVEGEVTEVEDFEEFDNMAYQADPSALPGIVHNPETGWFLIKDPGNATLFKVSHNAL